MKKIVLLIAGIFLVSLTTFADNSSEAIESLDNAKGMITAQNYSKAVEEINYALSKINEIQAEKLGAFIPEAPKGFKKENQSAQSLGGMGALLGSANGITANGSYIDEKQGVNPDSEEQFAEVTVTISVGGLLGKAGMFANIGMVGGADSGSKTIRIKGYTGTTTYSKENKNGTLTVQIGEKATIMIEGRNIANADVLKTFADAIKLADLEKF